MGALVLDPVVKTYLKNLKLLPGIYSVLFKSAFLAGLSLIEMTTKRETSYMGPTNLMGHNIFRKNNHMSGVQVLLLQLNFGALRSNITI